MTQSVPFIITFLLALLSYSLIDNVVLVRFYGICSFIGIGNKVKASVSMGFAVTFVIVLASLVCFPIYYYVLYPLHIAFMDTLTFILVIASLVQVVGLFIKKYSPSLYKAFGLYLPLITTNCAVLGVVTENSNEAFAAGFAANAVNVSGTVMTVSQFFGHCMANAIGTSLGYLLMIFVYACIRERLNGYSSEAPRSFKGVAQALIVAAIMSIAMMGLSGIGA